MPACSLQPAQLHALDHQVDRLAEDHLPTRSRLADGLQRSSRACTVEMLPQTNIVFVDVVGDGRERAGRTRSPYLKAPRRAWLRACTGLRFVTHLDVDAAGRDHAVATVRRFFAEAPAAPSSAACTGPY